MVDVYRYRNSRARPPDSVVDANVVGICFCPGLNANSLSFAVAVAALLQRPNLAKQ